MLETDPLAGIVSVRIPLLPLAVAESLLAADEPEPVLRELFATCAGARIAVFLASPGLYRGMLDWLDGKRVKNAKAAQKLLAYAMRMSMRATPFGMFAAVGAVATGERQTLRTRTRTYRFRHDAAWLAARVRSVLDDPAQREDLRVFSNDAYREAGDRLFVTPFLIKNATGDDEFPLRSPASIRKTAAVEAALLACADGMRYGDLVRHLANAFAVPERISRRLIDDLWDAGMFVPALRTPPIGSGIDHVLAHLPQANALHTQLTAERATLARLNAVSATPGEDAVVAAMTELRGAAPGDDHIVQVDAAIALEGTLAQCVLNEAAILGALLLENGRVVQLTALRDAWQRRIDTPNTLVPLLEIADADIGFDDLAALTEDAADVGRTSPMRIAAAAEAALRGCEEIELTADDLARWFPPPAATAPATMDVAFTVHAASQAELEAGNFLIADAPLTTAKAGASIGRFADLLPDMAGRLRELNATADDGALHAELLYVPNGRSANVCTRSLLYRHYIADGIIVAEGERISMRDLRIGFDAGQFYVYSKTHQQRVVIHESHLMTLRGDVSPACRLLALIARQGLAPRPFDWGAAIDVPVLPRIRYGRVVLSPRRWRMPAELFTPKPAAAVDAIRAWRQRWNCPAHVRFGNGDQFLTVNLDTPAFIALIVDQRRDRLTEPVDVLEILERSARSIVRDAAGAGYAAEFVAGLRVRPAATERIAPKRPPVAALEPPHAFGLGSSYVYLKLYCAKHQMDRALTETIAPAMQGMIADGLADRWFFIRYADPDPHIRLRVHASDDRAAALREELAALSDTWLAARTYRRVAADTYVPETSRYGGIAALPLIERIFMHSSFACAIDAAAAPDKGERIRRSAISALALFAPLVERLGMPWWLAAFPEPRPARSAAFWHDLKVIAAVPVEPMPATRDDLIALTEEAANGELDAIVYALLHMHVNRSGVNADDEPTVRALIAETYRSRLARAGKRA